LLLDIGGGSTEFIVARGEEEPQLLQSINIGGARMLEFFGLPDPLSSEQEAGLRDYIRQELAELMQTIQALEPQVLIGASGTFETLAELVIRRRQPPPYATRFNGFVFQRSEFGPILQDLMQSSHQTRLTMPGLATERVDMIVMGAMLLEYVLENTGIQQIQVSESALKEGVMYTYGLEALRSTP
jgi:exopolyphosphatase/guanosine-5'-triphosphate,3'-diphosphate pyrophosphatase